MTASDIQGVLPEKYRKMAEAIRHNPPSEIVKLALDTYIMFVTWLGSPAWSDEHLGQVSAWAMMAGYPECCALHRGLNAVILLASYRFCLRGRCIPDMELLDTYFAPYVRTLFLEGVKTEWLPALMQRYSITGWEKINYTEMNPDILLGAFRQRRVKR